MYRKKKKEVIIVVLKPDLRVKGDQDSNQGSEGQLESM
jgi:hypothetical protein